MTIPSVNVLKTTACRQSVYSFEPIILNISHIRGDRLTASSFFIISPLMLKILTSKLRAYSVVGATIQACRGKYCVRYVLCKLMKKTNYFTINGIRKIS